MSELEEALASYAHEAWAGFTRWMLDRIDTTHDSGETFRARWERQIATPYSALSEGEKESDRIEARKILAIVGAELDATVIERDALAGQVAMLRYELEIVAETQPEPGTIGERVWQKLTADALANTTEAAQAYESRVRDEACRGQAKFDQEEFVEPIRARTEALEGALRACVEALEPAYRPEDTLGDIWRIARTVHDQARAALGAERG